MANRKRVKRFTSKMIRLYACITYLKSIVSVIYGVFDHEVLECRHSQLSDLWASLESIGHLSQKKTHQEMVLTVVLSQAVLQTLIWNMSFEGQYCPLLVIFNLTFIMIFFCCNLCGLLVESIKQHFYFIHLKDAIPLKMHICKWYLTYRCNR